MGEPRVAGQGRVKPHLSGPLAMLFAGWAGMAVACTLAHVATLVVTTGVGRLTTLETVRLAVRVLEKLGLPSHVVEVVLGAAWELGSVSQVAQFAAPALVSDLVVALTAAAAASPAVVLVYRASRGGPEWFWGRVYPLGVLLAGAFPLIEDPVHRWLMRSQTPRAGMGVVIAGVIVAIGLVVLLAVLRTRTAIDAFVRSTFCTALPMAGIVLVASLLAPLRSRSIHPVLRAGVRPNVLLVSIDTLRADHLGVYGYSRQTSPHLDELARDGVVFQTVTSASSWTLPAHITMLTGLSPTRHGVVDDLSRLNPAVVTLPEALRAAGYETVGFVSGAYLRAEYGFMQGFSRFDDNTFVGLPVSASAMVDAVRTWLDDWQRSPEPRPFFVFLHLFDVHDPYAPPSPYDRMFDPEYRGGLSAGALRLHIEPPPSLSPRDLEHLVALYDGEIRFTDAHLGRLLRDLQERGLDGRTLVVVTSDHGEEFFEHGVVGHRLNLYDTTLRVPLIMRLPQVITRGRRIESPVRLMEVAPTILGLVGLQAATVGGRERPGPNTAQDLAGVLRAPAGEPFPLPGLSELRNRQTSMTALRTATHKLIWRRCETGFCSELYDLMQDPNERADLTGRQPALLAKMQASLSLAARAESVLASGLAPDAAQVERTRALGYVR